MTDAEVSAELKPCPFCGSGQTLVEPDSKYWVGMRYEILSYRVRHWCEENTGVRGSMINMKAKTKAEAIGKWNQRIALVPAGEAQ